MPNFLGNAHNMDTSVHQGSIENTANKPEKKKKKLPSPKL
jgi:hypothetical protein